MKDFTKNIVGVLRSIVNQTEENIIEYKGKAYRIISDIRDGLRSAFSYVGAGDVLDFQAKAKFVQVTESGRIEAKPHLL